MEYDSITIDAVEPNFWPLLVPLSVLVLSIILGVLFFKAMRGKTKDRSVLVCVVVGIVSFIVSLMTLVALPALTADFGIRDNQKTALETQLGFTEVEIDVYSDEINDYTGIDADGQPVNGLLIETGHNEYTLVPLP